MSSGGFKNRKKIKMLLYIDYHTQKSDYFFVGPDDRRVKIYLEQGTYFLDQLDGSDPKGYSRIKYLINDLDEEVLNHLDKLIF